MSMKIVFPSQFSLSLITLALSSSLAHANNVEPSKGLIYLLTVSARKNWMKPRQPT